MTAVADMTPILATEAKAALALYLDDAGVESVGDRHAALRREYAYTWLAKLQEAGLANGLDVWDVIAGRDLLCEELMAQMPDQPWTAVQP